MRLTGLEVQGFRGFAGAHAFDLDADAIVILGANGQGKTSFFDAVLWCLTGRLERIGSDASRVLSMYSKSGTARVKLALRDSAGVTWSVGRIFDGEAQQFRVECDGQVEEGQSAFLSLQKAIWPDGLRTDDGVRALSAALTRSVYMQQDLVRQFVDADDEKQRFTAVGELFGAGRVTELQLQLESARNAWSRSTTLTSKEHESAKMRLLRLEEQLRRFGIADEAAITLTEDVWDAWWVVAVDCGIERQTATRLGSNDVPRALDSALRQLESLRRSAERTKDDIAAGVSELSRAPTAPDADVQTIRNAVAEAERQLAIARSELSNIEARAADLRSTQVAQKEQSEQLRALARLALSQLGAHCPVCAQEYDVEGTRARLQGFLTSGPSSTEPSTLDKTLDVGAAATAVKRREIELIDLQATLNRISDAEIARSAWVSRKNRRLEELGLATTEDASVTLSRALVGAEQHIARLTAHREEGERLALALTKASEITRRAETERELAIARGEVQKIQEVLMSRESTGEVATQIINGLREAASDVVEQQLSRMEPLLQRIYSGIDPHPSFRTVRLLTRLSRGRGHLSAYIEDTDESLSTEVPAAVLSSSQMNALAISIFLALNLGAPRLPLDAVLLDDPLQSLDDLNLLGLVDLLRRLKDQRQVIVSTHDAKFAALLARKMRPASAEKRTRVIELDSWEREGLVVTQRSIYCDPLPLRIIA